MAQKILGACLWCLCCRKKVHKASSATHRSLPDIPTVDDIEAATGGSGVPQGLSHDGDGGKAADTNSDLYATVGDKVVQQQRIMPGHVLDMGKQASSQHSSLSQADDISSPYASVRSPPHAYDKIRKAEHPYAQLQPTASNAIAETSSNGSRRASSESLLGSDAEEAGGGRQVEIPAASAIAGRVSASQELPYMTPPIVQTQQPNLPSQPPQLHFSGDSQDSSKGYTSISVREPLANILAQTKSAQQSLQQRKLARNFHDSHYATVSDDSDEMYAAIEDPNQVGELYTSGSETYAQIQPMMVVNAEVNAAPVSVTGPVASSVSVVDGPSTVAVPPPTISTMEPPPPPIITAPTLPPPPTQHSRQASSSSSIGGILGSPKPEKRQANSPLPPTPKSSGTNKTLAGSGGHYLSNTTLNSGRNSVASSHGIEFSPSRGKDGDALGKEGEAAMSKKKSPSKDLEGMYAKVMKKNKLSNVPSENSSPLFGRRMGGGDLDMGESSTGSSSREGSAEKQVNVEQQNNYETIERITVTKRGKAPNGNTNRDPGYETIPGDKCRRDLMDSLNATQEMAARSRNSAPAGILAEGIHKVSQNSLNILKGGMDGVLVAAAAAQEEPLSLISNDDPGYETVRQVGGIPPSNSSSGIKVNRSDRRHNSMNESSSEHDPNYETLLPNSTNSNVAPHKPQPQSRRFGDDEEDDGYSMIRPAGTGSVSTVPQPVALRSDNNDGYSSIKNIPDDKVEEDDDDDDGPGYSQIGKRKVKDVHGYASIDETRKDRLDTSGMTTSISGTTTNSSMSPVSPINYFPAPSAETSTGFSVSTTPSSEFSSTEVNLIRNSEMMTSAEGNNYESLTSDDPNYETVRHLKALENPYEVLENELGTPALEVVVAQMIPVVVESGILHQTANEKCLVGPEKGKISPTDSPEVGDYFQV